MTDRVKKALRNFIGVYIEDLDCEKCDYCDSTETKGFRSKTDPHENEADDSEFFCTYWRENDCCPRPECAKVNPIAEMIADDVELMLKEMNLECR